MKMVTLKMQPRFAHIKVKLFNDGVELYVPSNPDIPSLTLTSDLSKFDKDSKVTIRLITLYIYIFFFSNPCYINFACYCKRINFR